MTGSWLGSIAGSLCLATLHRPSQAQPPPQRQPSLRDSRLRQDGDEEAYLGNEIFGGSLCLGIAHRTTTATAAAIAIAAAAIATATGRGAQPPGSTPSRRG